MNRYMIEYEVENLVDGRLVGEEKKTIIEAETYEEACRACFNPYTVGFIKVNNITLIE